MYVTQTMWMPESNARISGLTKTQSGKNNWCDECFEKSPRSAHFRSEPVLHYEHIRNLGRRCLDWRWKTDSGRRFRAQKNKRNLRCRRRIHRTRLPPWNKKPKSAKNVKNRPPKRPDESLPALSSLTRICACSLRLSPFQMNGWRDFMPLVDRYQVKVLDMEREFIKNNWWKSFSSE